MIQGSIFAVHGGLPRRCTWDECDSDAAALVDASTVSVASSAPSGSALPTHAASAPARAPIEVLLDTLPRPWSGENPNDASNKACTAGYDMLWADPVQVNPQLSSLNPKNPTLNQNLCRAGWTSSSRTTSPTASLLPLAATMPFLTALLQAAAAPCTRPAPVWPPLFVCLCARAPLPPSSLPPLEGLQTAHFRLCERGAGPFPGAQWLLWNIEGPHGQTVCTMLCACLLANVDALQKVRSSNRQMRTRSHCVQHFKRPPPKQVSGAVAVRHARVKRARRGQAGCVSVCGGLARMIVLTPSSFCGCSQANLHLMQ